ncbi:MAG: hypothetical protein FJ189_10985 [Gammaproteobacteria bacterium]|nr:hypothetical protein [Gammaproteobacteria bacterium]
MKLDDYIKSKALVRLEDFDQEFFHLLDVRDGKALAIVVNPIESRTLYRVDTESDTGKPTTRYFSRFKDAYQAYFQEPPRKWTPVVVK